MGLNKLYGSFMIAGILLLTCLSVVAFGQNENLSSLSKVRNKKRVDADELLRRVTKKVEPKFPSAATAALLSLVKELVVEVTVNEHGEVVGTRLISGSSLLRDAAVEAAKTWKFVPPKDEGLSQIVGPIIFENPSEMLTNMLRGPDYYLEEVKREPDSWIARCRLARAFWWRKRNQEALGEYKKAISLNPQAAIAYYGFGKIYAEQKQYDKALESYQRAIQIKPDFVEALMGIGWVFARTNKLEESNDTFKQAISVSPDLGVKEIVYTNLASNYRRMKKPDEELEAHKQLINVKFEKYSIDPKLEDGFGIASSGISLAARYRKLGYCKEAIEVYKKNIEIDPLSGAAWESHFGMAYCYEDLGDDVSAMKVYEKLLQLTSESLKSVRGKGREGEVYNSRGIIYEHMKLNEEAIESYKKAAKLKPIWVKPHIGLHRLYLKTGDKAAAAKEYKIIEKLDEETAKSIREAANIPK